MVSWFHAFLVSCSLFLIIGSQSASCEFAYTHPFFERSGTSWILERLEDLFTAPKPADLEPQKNFFQVVFRHPAAISFDKMIGLTGTTDAVLVLACTLSVNLRSSFSALLDFEKKNSLGITDSAIALLNFGQSALLTFEKMVGLGRVTQRIAEFVLKVLNVAALQILIQLELVGDTKDQRRQDTSSSPFVCTLWAHDRRFPNLACISMVSACVLLIASFVGFLYSMPILTLLAVLFIAAASAHVLVRSYSCVYALLASGKRSLHCGCAIAAMVVPWVVQMSLRSAAAALAVGRSHLAGAARLLGAQLSTALAVGSHLVVGLVRVVCRSCAGALAQSRSLADGAAVLARSFSETVRPRPLAWLRHLAVLGAKVLGEWRRLAAKLSESECLRRGREAGCRLAGALGARELFACCVCGQEQAVDHVAPRAGGCACAEGVRSCRDCAAAWVQSKVGEQVARVPCPGGCQAPLGQADVRDLADDDTWARYLVLDRQLYTRTSPLVHTCPRPSADGRGCPGEGELEEGETTFVCPVCFTMRCVVCNVESGPGSQHPTTCAAYTSWRADNDRGEAFLGNYLAALGRARLRCPVCRRDFEKDGGCNHMTCPCGTHYCSVCGDAVSATSPHDHFQPGHPTARTPHCPLFHSQ